MDAPNMSSQQSPPAGVSPGQAAGSPGRKLRILVGKAGLDGHDRGAKVVARALADAGYEVIYTGLHQTPEMIAATAVQESVDAVGLSIMSGAHMTLFPAVLAALRARGAGDVMLFGGGIVPKDDAAQLATLGVGAIFTPGASTREIVDWIERELRPRVEKAAAAFAAGADDPSNLGQP
jgi:methylmalonyl-CoA mutase C-terminal domain/subunit